jgi:hypothetical protein
VEKSATKLSKARKKLLFPYPPLYFPVSEPQSLLPNTGILVIGKVRLCLMNC